MTKPIQKIIARESILGEGLAIRRALPSRERRMIGAWCFLDHLGPVGSKQPLRVGSHPHIGLQTFTWMIEGEVLHRDSLGYEQVIRPGEVNLMTAGHGIAHTEDSLPDTARLHTAQLWIALPPEQVDRPPAFEHYATLPRWQQGSASFTLLVGELNGQQAPTQVYSPLLGVDIESAQAGDITLDLRADFEYGCFVLYGEATIDGQRVEANELVYMAPGREHLTIETTDNTRLLFIGGTPAPAVTMWWNFVAYDKEYIKEAQRAWEEGSERYPEVKGGEHRRIDAPPLPWK